MTGADEWPPLALLPPWSWPPPPPCTWMTLMIWSGAPWPWPPPPPEECPPPDPPSTLIIYEIKEKMNQWIEELNLKGRHWLKELQMCRKIFLENTQAFVYFVRNIFLSIFSRKATDFSQYIMHGFKIRIDWNWMKSKPWLFLLVVKNFRRLMTIRSIHLNLNCHCCHHPKRMPMHWGTATTHKER